MQPHRQAPAKRSRRQLTVEEYRLSDPSVSRLLAASALSEHAGRFRARLAQATSPAGARAIVDAEGLALWRAACAAAATTEADDRPLYWVRLLLTAYLRCSYVPSFELPAADRDALITRVERASRGMSELTFATQPAHKRILISGFDPFRLDAAADRSNPSGAAALLLDGESIGHGALRAQVRAVILPVRFRDFDRGLVEATFRPLLEPRPDGRAGVDLLVTISQNNTKGYEIEHWAGRRRTLEASDNLGQFGAHATTRGTGETIPLGATAGDREFEQTSLPVEAMLRAASALGTDVIRENMSRTPEHGEPAVRGSGGNYLSNEVFYRASSLERTTRSVAGRTRACVPVGHLHVPLIEVEHASTDAGYAERRQQIANHVKAILSAALHGI